MATTFPAINFHGAARRHYHDADLLWQHQREANAGQLYGFVADFAYWLVDHRYYDASALPPSAAKWQYAAQQVMQMLDQAKLDGVIP